MTQSLAFCTLPKKWLSIIFESGDPMHLLPVPNLLIRMNLFFAQVQQVVGVSWQYEINKIKKNIINNLFIARVIEHEWKLHSVWTKYQVINLILNLALKCPRKFRDKEYSAEQKLQVAGFERGRRERNFWVAYWKGEHLDGDENSAAVKCDTRLVQNWTCIMHRLNE